MKHPIIITRDGKTMTYTQWFINRYGFKIGIGIINPRGIISTNPHGEMD